MAITLSQTGILYAQTDRVADAVPLTLQSLVLRLEMQSLDVCINLHWLSR